MQKEMAVAILGIAGIFTAHAALAGCIQGPFSVGARSQTYIDSSRADRPVSVLIRYPALAPGGDNVPVVNICGEKYPVVSIGHGFTIAAANYQYLAAGLARVGVVSVLPTTEAGLSPNHAQFAADLQFAARAVITDPFFAGTNLAQRFYVGHSMGGGAAVLAAAADRNAAGLILFAPAQTNPSAIAAAARVRTTTLILLGSRDCVTPRAAHAQPIDDALSARIIHSIREIEGGSHCQFAAASASCQLAELSCGGSALIPEAQQQSAAKDFLVDTLQSESFSESLFYDDFE